ncbi:hypothetical protein TNCV_1651851 [Trichonephila clavipes]|nr:hypothetical protein TNCV_1651851 [Trichonephila clavipes]
MPPLELAAPGKGPVYQALEPPLSVQAVLMLKMPHIRHRKVDKITELIKVDRHVSSRSIAQELKIDHKTVLSYLSKVGFKKKLDVWVPHQKT